ncbi:MAG TPA: acetate uptake transporter [Rhodanobacteraceae bacterium]
MAEQVETAKPQANPAGLGLIGFGMTTVLLSFVNAGVLPAGGESIVLPMAFAYGGLIQIIAGILEFKNGNTFGMVAFLSYGAFWWWFAFMVWLGDIHLLDLSAAGSAIAVALLCWGVFTFYMWISTFKLNVALWVVFLTLWITYALLGLGALYGVQALSRAGGWVGIICGLSACYTSFAIVTNTTFKRAVLPI